MVKNLPAVQETQVPYLGQGDSRWAEGLSQVPWLSGYPVAHLFQAWLAQPREIPGWTPLHHPPNLATPVSPFPLTLEEP